MSWFSRKKTFEEGKTVSGPNFEAEFDAIADAFNGLFDVGVVAASSDLVLTTNYQDVPGASLSITPTIASKLLVFPAFEFYGGSEGITVADARGTVDLDGAAQTRQARMETNGYTRVTSAITVPQFYVLSLNAGAHTVKLRAKKTETPPVECLAANTAFLYLRIPEP